MKTAQTTLKNEVEFCEHSEPIDTYFRCKLTDFGFVNRCTVEDREQCPDLEFFRNQEKNQGRAKK